MTVALDQELQEAAKYAEELFLERPRLGIDDAARLIAEKCRRGLAKPTISRIRQEVRAKVDFDNLFRSPADKIKTGPVIIRNRLAFNPPRVVINPDPVDVKAQIQKLAVQQQQAYTVETQRTVMPEAKPEPTPTTSSAEERKKYLEDWALDHPLATIEQARAAVKERFGGVAVGTKAISDTLRETKRLVEAEALAKRMQTTAPTPTPANPIPLQQRIADWAKEMRAAGVRQISLNDDGSARVDFFPA